MCIRDRPNPLPSKISANTPLNYSIPATMPHAGLSPRRTLITPYTTTLTTKTYDYRAKTSTLLYAFWRCVMRRSSTV